MSCTRHDFAAGRVPYWVAWLMFACAVHCTSLRAEAQSVPKEYQIKAVFLWRLAQFVEWPSNAFEATNSPIVIGMLGDSPFGNALDLAVQGETAHNRPVVVQYFRRVEQVRTCHILYVSRSERSRLPAIFRSLAGRSILTVSDTEGFAVDYGGMIEFLSSENNKVALRVNIDAVKEPKLTLDARLLRVAEVVRSK
jgi:hypothetical protein